MGIAIVETVYEKIVKAYPELRTQTELFSNGTIVIKNDKDHKGAYISVWGYSKPLPAGLKLGK